MHMNDENVRKPLDSYSGGTGRPQNSPNSPSYVAAESRDSAQSSPDGSDAEELYQESEADIVVETEDDNYSKDLSEIKSDLYRISKYLISIHTFVKKNWESSQSIPSDLKSALTGLGPVKSQLRDVSVKLDRLFNDITGYIETNRNVTVPAVEKGVGLVLEKLTKIADKIALVSRSVDNSLDANRTLLESISLSAERDLSRRMEALSKYFQSLIYQISVNFGKRTLSDDDPLIAKLRKIGDVVQKIRMLGENFEPLIKGSFGEIESKLPQSPDWKKLRDDVKGIFPKPGQEMTEFIRRQALLDVETVLGNEGEEIPELVPNFLSDPASACLTFFEQEIRKRISRELQSIKAKPIDNPSSYIEKLPSHGVSFIRELDSRAKRKEIDPAILEPLIRELLEALNLSEIVITSGQTQFNFREHREVEKRISSHRSMTVLEVLSRGFMRKDRTQIWPADVAVADG